MTSKYLFIDKYDYLFYCVCVSGTNEQYEHEHNWNGPQELPGKFWAGGGLRGGAKWLYKKAEVS